MSGPVQDRFEQLKALSAALTARIEAARPRLTQSLGDGVASPQDGPTKASRANHELREVEQALGDLTTAYRQLVAAIWRENERK